MLIHSLRDAYYTSSNLSKFPFLVELDIDPGDFYIFINKIEPHELGSLKTLSNDLEMLLHQLTVEYKEILKTFKGKGTKEQKEMFIEKTKNTVFQYLPNCICPTNVAAQGIDVEVALNAAKVGVSIIIKACAFALAPLGLIGLLATVVGQVFGKALPLGATTLFDSLIQKYQRSTELARHANIHLASTIATLATARLEAYKAIANKLAPKSAEWPLPVGENFTYKVTRRPSNLKPGENPRIGIIIAPAFKNEQHWCYTVRHHTTEEGEIEAFLRNPGPDKQGNAFRADLEFLRQNHDQMILSPNAFIHNHIRPTKTASQPPILPHRTPPTPTRRGYETTV